MNVGVIGLGLIGSRRFAAAQRGAHPVVFAVDPDPARWRPDSAPSCQFASRLADVHGVRAQAAFVALPHHLAREAVRWALEHDLHVLCEKPLGLDHSQAAELCQLAAQKHRQLAIGFNYRFLAGVTQLQSLLQAGQFGPIQRARMLLAHGGRPGMEKEWKLSRAAAGGGALLDPGIHLIDLVRFLLGEPEVKSVRLRRDFWPIDVEDNARAELVCGPVDIDLEISLTHWQNQFQIEIYGTEGMAIVSGRGGNYGPQRLQFVNRWFWQPGRDQRRQFDFGPDEPSFELETQAFLDWAAGHPRPSALATGADALAAAELLDTLYSLAPPLPSAANQLTASGV